MLSVTQEIARDSRAHGRGRKKWWADRLGIPPLTLSHWLAGRQSPSGRHALAIREMINAQEREEHIRTWMDRLWETHFAKEKVPSTLLPMIVVEILSVSKVDSRSWALISLFVESTKGAHWERPADPRLRNRLGWLLAISRIRAAWKPVRKGAPQPLSLQFAGTDPYFQKFQTKTGKKWRILDFSLDELKNSLGMRL